MPETSDRSSEILHSPIRELMPYARQAKKEGVHVYHLNIGQPDIPTPQRAYHRLRTMEEKVIGYGASEGMSELREVVVDYYCQNVSNIDIEDVYVTTGASEAILFTLFACFDPGQEIIIPEPFYANYIGFSQVSGVSLIPVQSSIESGFDLPKISDFAKRITDRTKALFLCNPGNPSGCLYSSEGLEEIAQLAIENDLFLIVDEVYREFSYEKKFVSVLELPEVRDRVVVLDSVSKVFSACGARVGFVISRNQEVMKNILKYAELRLCPPVIGQEVAMACFQERTEYLKAVKEEYNNRRLFLYDRLSKIPGIVSYLPDAAFYIMASLPVDDSQSFCKWMLSNFRLNGSTVMLAPGHGFYLSEGHGKDQVRIAFVLGVEHLGKGMDCLEKGLEEYARVKSMKRSLTLQS